MRLRRSMVALLACGALVVGAPATAQAHDTDRPRDQRPGTTAQPGDAPSAQPGDADERASPSARPGGTDRRATPSARPGGTDRGGTSPAWPGDTSPARPGGTSPARPGGPDGPDWGGGSPCRPGTPDTAPETEEFYQDEAFLGPEQLPTAPPVGPLLKGYDRFGDLTEAEFLARYRNGDAWVYPPADGFVVTEEGEVLKYPERLWPGTRLDRFGFPGGSYLAPAGTSFAERALPPQNLNTPADSPQSNYHVYCVLRPFTVLTGPIAPWFGQPGLGAQYKLELRYLPQAGTALSVDWLLRNGYLVEERPDPRGAERCDTALEYLYSKAC